MHLKVQVLGSGTSTGVPVVGCECAVCQSEDPKNKRLRSAVLLTRMDTGEHLMIDTSPDLRMQMLNAGVQRLSKVLWTHTHADHCHGFDDLRAFCFRQEEVLDGYLKYRDREDLERRFAYAFESNDYTGVVPKVRWHTFEDGEVFYPWPDFPVEAAFFPHGAMQSTGYRFGCFAFVTDFQYCPQAVLERWRGRLHTMLASGLHDHPHASHSSIPETLQLFERLQVKHGIITHTSHRVEYHQKSAELPAGVELAYDGMSFGVNL